MLSQQSFDKRFFLKLERMGVKSRNDILHSVLCVAQFIYSFGLFCHVCVERVVLRLQSWSSSYKVLDLTPFYLKSHRCMSLMQHYLKSIIADKSRLMSASDRSQNNKF